MNTSTTSACGDFDKDIIKRESAEAAGAIIVGVCGTAGAWDRVRRRLRAAS